MSERTANLPHKETGVTLVELLVTLVITVLLFAGLNSIVTGVLGSRVYLAERLELTREAEFAMDRMVRTVSHSRRLLVPMPDKAGSNWPENIREQTVPDTAPVGDSVYATAILAVTLPAYYDLDFDGIPDADDDGDGQIDEDLHRDTTNDFATGIFEIDDDGDGFADEGGSWWDDDESSDADEDPINGLDDDNDGLIDEDPPADVNADGEPGLSGVDDDGDGLIDEGDPADDDEDGENDEDSYNAVVYELYLGVIEERLPVPWDENGDGSVNGRDFIWSTLAENANFLRFERVPTPAGQPELVDITLGLATATAGTVTLNTRVRVGGAL
ncbi:MAG: prepilin-type N-terminal cleavage/methylation domain-containing protein [Gammaproteobacteria bacterium]|nr:prepilin-type N-terminal cleavage/methylation domain-containing protein [Gammaproteobacteria bacterium]